jgi:hypothetical protein
MLYLYEQDKKFKLVPHPQATDIKVIVDRGTQETTVIFENTHYQPALRDEIKALEIKLSPSQRTRLKELL